MVNESFVPYIMLGCVVFIVVTCICYRCRRMIGALLSSAISGWLALAVINLTGGLTGITLGVNLFSVGVVTLLGIPGAISILLLQIFW